MDRARTSRIPLLVAGSCLALAVFGAPGAVAAVSDFKVGTYQGKTKQETVDVDFRKIEFKLNRKGKIILMTEPVVRRDFCTSVPVFTLDGATPSKPLSGRGAFTFTNTFIGTRVDKVRGQFVSDTRVEGFVVYNFQGQSDLCTPGSVKVNFGASRQKKS